MCIVCIANNINRNVYMYLNTRIFPTTGYARVLLFMFIRRELGGTGTGCLFQFTYCVQVNALSPSLSLQNRRPFPGTPSTHLLPLCHLHCFRPVFYEDRIQVWEQIEVRRSHITCGHERCFATSN